MKNNIKMLLNKFSVDNVQRKEVKEQFELMLETLKGGDLVNLAEVANRLTSGITVRDESYLKLQSDLLRWVKDTKEQAHRLRDVNTIGEFIVAVLTHIEKEIVPDLQYEITSRLNSDNYISAMKYDTFYVVRLVELCDFAVNYSAMLLHYVLKTNTLGS